MPSPDPVAPAPRLSALLWQPIFDRHGQLHGHEHLARLSGRDSTESAFAAASAQQLWEISCEVLEKACHACLLRGCAQAPGLREFVNMEKTTLADPRILAPLLRTQELLALQDCRLVVEITERPLRDPRQRLRYIENLYRLKRQGIVLALDDCVLPLPREPVELAEELCDYVKVDLSQLGLSSLSEHAGRALLEALAEPMQRCIDRYRVEMIAEVIEDQWQYETMLALPFSYFQGYHLQRPHQVWPALLPQ
ncbi:EAL domain-containing protein [Stenotrophomonas sp. MMGLT7]|uniref:EAL domain-containing protein n=1 Tax=Stenotrophomonas sp. MMGLT7 TaxID=2901227 RepID=UPI001E5B3081|nr:EAL domain-containing protein [Stenotrophomonas sp. MMGLT7]MCD7099708.1 EAL domain-containing protein [Stenotrophomonas sp. MMGLT7]